jgi:hypothetical protein
LITLLRLLLLLFGPSPTPLAEEGQLQKHASSSFSVPAAGTLASTPTPTAACTTSSQECRNPILASTDIRQVLLLLLLLMLQLRLYLSN